jgi:hypothetical protein
VCVLFVFALQGNGGATLLAKKEYTHIQLLTAAMAAVVVRRL